MILSLTFSAFITSTTREVMPVVQLDDTIIGGGKVGPVTQKLMDAFNEHKLKDTK
jgi:D-alanine transaminase